MSKGVKWGGVDVRAFQADDSQSPASVRPGGSSSSSSSDAVSSHPRARELMYGGGAVKEGEEEMVEEEEEVDPSEAPPKQVFEGSGSVASAAREAARAAQLIEANGVKGYMAATEGAKDAAVAAGREARRIAQREFSAERARAVAAKMEATAQLDPADALPFGFVTKLRGGHEAAVSYCTWADDAQHIASCDAQGRVCVWDVHTCTVRREYTGHTGAVAQVVFSPVGDNDRLASCGKDGTVRLWAKRSGAQLFVLREQRCAIGCVAFCHDGSLLASGGEDGSVYIYNMEKLEREASYRRSSSASSSSAAAAPTEAALTADLAASIQGAELLILAIEGFPSRGEGHTGALRRCAWSPKDDSLATGGEDRVVRLWSIKDRGSLRVALEGHLGPVTDLAFCPQGSHAALAAAAAPSRHLLASASLDGTVRLWDWAQGECVRVLAGGGGRGGTGHMGGVTSLCWTYEGGGGRLVSGGMDRSLCVWGLPGGACTQLLPGVHKYHVTAVSMCPDGLHCATASADGTLGLFGAEPLEGWEWAWHELGALGRRAQETVQAAEEDSEEALKRGLQRSLGKASSKWGGVTVEGASPARR